MEKTVNITCRYCQHKIAVTEQFQDTFGDFCNVDCAQKSYEDNCFTNELNSENPDFDGLWEAGERVMLG